MTDQPLEQRELAQAVGNLISDVHSLKADAAGHERRVFALETDGSLFSRPGDYRAPRKGAIFEAMGRAFATVEEAGKSMVDAGPGGKFLAKTIDDVYRVVRHALADASVFPVPETAGWTATTRQTGGHRVVYRDDADVYVWFVAAADGSAVRTGPWRGRGEDLQDKSNPKAYSYAMKVACICTFLLPGEPEPDANAPGETVGDRRSSERPSQAEPVGPPSWLADWPDDLDYGRARADLQKRIKALSDDDRETVRAWMRDGSVTWTRITWPQWRRISDALDLAEAGMVPHLADALEMPQPALDARLAATPFAERLTDAADQATTTDNGEEHDGD